MVEGVAIPSGRSVASMTAVRCEAEMRRLTPTAAAIIAFARRVSQS